jgi:hypothetical protein
MQKVRIIYTIGDIDESSELEHTTELVDLNEIEKEILDKYPVLGGLKYEIIFSVNNEIINNDIDFPESKDLPF